MWREGRWVVGSSLKRTRTIDYLISTEIKPTALGTLRASYLKALLGNLTPDWPGKRFFALAHDVATYFLLTLGITQSSFSFTLRTG